VSLAMPPRGRGGFAGAALQFRPLERMVANDREEVK